MNIKLVTLFLLCFILVGCNTTPVYHSLIRNQKPELNKESSPINLTFSFGDKHKVELADSGEFYDEQETLDSAINVGYRVNDKFQIYLQGAGLLQYFGLKYAMPTTSAQDLSGFSHALDLRLSKSTYENDVSDSVYTNERGEAKYKRTHSVIDIAYTAGKRINKNVLVYAGPYFAFHEIDAVNRLGWSSQVDMDINSQNMGLMFGTHYSSDWGLGLSYELTTYVIKMGDFDDRGVQNTFSFEYFF